MTYEVNPYDDSKSLEAIESEHSHASVPPQTKKHQSEQPTVTEASISTRKTNSDLGNIVMYKSECIHTVGKIFVAKNLGFTKNFILHKNLKIKISWVKFSFIM